MEVAGSECFGLSTVSKKNPKPNVSKSELFPLLLNHQA